MAPPGGRGELPEGPAPGSPPPPGGGPSRESSDPRRAQGGERRSPGRKGPRGASFSRLRSGDSRCRPAPGWKTAASNPASALQPLQRPAGHSGRPPPDLPALCTAVPLPEGTELPAISSLCLECSPPSRACSCKRPHGEGSATYPGPFYRMLTLRPEHSEEPASRCSAGDGLVGTYLSTETHPTVSLSPKPVLCSHSREPRGAH